MIQFDSSLNSGLNASQVRLMTSLNTQNGNQSDEKIKYPHEGFLMSHVTTFDMLSDQDRLHLAKKVFSFFAL